MIHAFPKIFTLGQDYIADIFNEDVEITEKIDGSQFVFGKLNNTLVMRSKGVVIEDYYTRSDNDLFYPVIQWVISIQDDIPDNTYFYGETLKTPKHNTLTYGRVPSNHFMLFAIATAAGTFVQEHSSLAEQANILGCEVVPLLYKGKIKGLADIEKFIDIPSALGNTNAEGIVCKNYSRPFLLGGQPIPLMAGKYVTEKFKEVHRTSWGKENTSAGKWGIFKQQFRSVARWDKAIQHLRDNGELENSPRDIGKLINAIKVDIAEEEQDTIKNFLWNHYGQEAVRTSTAGFPEYYKKKLLENSFE